MNVVSERLPPALRAYRILTAAAGPFTPLLLARRAARGKEDRARLGERRGIGSTARGQGPLVWVHGASVGELVSMLPLIERIRERNIGVMVTTGTVTSGGVAARRLPNDVVHQYAPLDVPHYVRRFLDRWQPDLALFAESDLWPNRIIETSRRRIPMILINGRLSDNSFQRWLNLPGPIANLLQRLDLCLARTDADADRLSALGARHVVTSGDLKLDVPAPSCDPDKLAALQAAVRGRPVIAAASTHEGEEATMIDVHRHLRREFPGLLSIIAPRHPDRGPGIAELAAAKGLNVGLRSVGDQPAPGTDIYVADTMGELGLFYRLAPVVFVGGSLVQHGGQNPIEPAKLGAAILHGPHVWNFTELYAALDQARGALIVNDAGNLIEAFRALLADRGFRQHTATRALNTVEAMGGALARTLQSLEPYFMQLRLKAQQGSPGGHA